MSKACGKNLGSNRITLALCTGLIIGGILLMGTGIYGLLDRPVKTFKGAQLMHHWRLEWGLT